jgi:2-polyprenyl-6-methoxyphenol hydroxylase-like FAD-dependent oxidoreductase
VHVLIIGAGTGGMCLAHGLRRAGVSVAVYERDRTRSDGLHGYRVGVDPTGNRALGECLPPELFDTFIATCARAPGFMNVLTERMRFTATIPLRPDTDPIESERSVSRMTLRQLLFTGMEDVVAFDKTFTHFERNDEGTVTAHFTDGTTATGDVLVGADGANSAVRQQYLPHAGLKDTGIVSIAAKVPVTEETKALLPERVFNGISLVFAPKGQFGILHVMEFKWDAAGTIKGGIGSSDAELIGRWPGLLFDNTRDYINWALWTSVDRYPADVTDLRGEDVVSLALRMASHWHPNMRRLIALSDPASAFSINIRTSEPIEPWKSSTVTLLGDAIHTMTPGQGVGANTALRDAAWLSKQLAAANDGSMSLLDAVTAYEAEMIPYGFARVADSLAQNGTSAGHPLYKPFIGRALLAFNRMYFRAVDRIPSLKKKFVDDLYSYRGS